MSEAGIETEAKDIGFHHRRSQRVWRNASSTDRMAFVTESSEEQIAPPDIVIPKIPTVVVLADEGRVEVYEVGRADVLEPYDAAPGVPVVLGLQSAAKWSVAP